MAHVGLSLMRDTSMHKFFVPIGDRQSGKSTLLALANIANDIGDFDFVGSSIFKKDVEGKRARFKNAQRRIACIDELPPEAFHEGEELLKVMAAHSGVEMRGMYKDEHGENRWFPKLIMATNDAPLYRDYSGAIRERAIFGEVAKALPEKDRDGLLLEKMRPEVGSWVVACLDMARQVRERHYYPLSAAMKRKTEEVSSTGNPLKDFVRTKCILSPEAKVFSSDLYEVYRSYMQNNGHKPMASNTLSAALKTMFGVTPKLVRINEEAGRGLEGIRLRRPGDPEPEDDDTFTDDEPLVYTVYTVSNETVTGTVYDMNGHVERADEQVYTVYTVDSEKVPFRKTPCVQEDHTHGVSIREEDFSKRPYTPYTDTTKEPVVRDEGVYGPVYGQNETVYTVYTQDDDPSIEQQLQALGQYWRSHNVRTTMWPVSLCEASKGRFNPQKLPVSAVLLQIGDLAKMGPRETIAVQRFIREAQA